MSQENIEKVRSLLEPFAGINVADVDWRAQAMREAIRELHTPDVELRTLASGLGTGIDSEFHGLDELVRYLQEWLDPFSEYWIDPVEYIEARDCVLVSSRQRGIGAGSGPGWRLN